MSTVRIHISVMQVLSTLLIGACCVVPLDGLYDQFLSPKWYMGLCLLSAVLAHCGWKSFHRNRFSGNVTDTVCISAHIVLWYCLAYTILHDVLLQTGSRLFVIPIRGMYDNASGLSLNLCILLAMAMTGYDRFGKFWRGLLVIAFLLVPMVVVFVMSRTGMICMALLATFCLARVSCISKYVKAVVAVALFACAVSVVVMTKDASTSGRSFILERTMEIVSQRPLTGFGLYGFEREYMASQGDFLASHPDSPTGWYADDITHPLNEFLYLWTDFGIIAPLILALVLLFPFVWYTRTRNRDLRLSLLPLSVVFLFSVFSYPFKYPLSYIALLLPYILLLKSPMQRLYNYQPKIFAVALMLSGVAVMTFTLTEFHFERHWSHLIRISEAGGSRGVADRFDRLYGHYHNNPYFLYSDMVVQYKAGHCRKAMELYEELTGYQSGYNMELLAGDAQTYLKKYDEALEHYRRASNMCPVRFAPLYGMLEVYKHRCNSVRADSVAHVILNKKVKVPSSAVENIKQEAQNWLNRQQIKSVITKYQTENNYSTARKADSLTCVSNQ